VGGAVLLVALIVVLWRFDPSVSTLLPPCPFQTATGLYCPGCGSTRALHALLHADLPAALSMNPLMVIAIPLVIALSLRPAWSYRAWVPWTILGVIVAFGILRNIDIWPFRLLAPH
jgi:hypothetical protein